VKLAAKITVALVVGILAVMGTYAYVQVFNEVVLYKADIERGATERTGLARRDRVGVGTEGEARARELIAISARRVENSPRPRSAFLSLAEGAPDRPALLPEEIRALEAARSSAVFAATRRASSGGKHMRPSGPRPGQPSSR